VVVPDGRTLRVETEAVRAGLVEEAEAEFSEETKRLIAAAGLAGRQADRAEAALVAARLGSRPLTTWWELRLPQRASWWRLMYDGRLGRKLALFVGAEAAHLVLVLWSWSLLGRVALGGGGRSLVPWVAALVATVPMQMVATATSYRLAIDAGFLLKRRLLAGALSMEPEETRHLGVGQLLGRVIESEAVETLALGGGLLAVVALMELVGAAVVLAHGVGGAASVVALGLWCGLVAATIHRLRRHRAAWTAKRLELTQDLVEQMVGHRTRAAQGDAARQEEQETAAEAGYARLSRRLDHAEALLTAILPQAWIGLGVLVLLPSLKNGSTQSLAIGFGGTLLAFQAFRDLGASASDLLAATISARAVRRLFNAGTRKKEPSTAVRTNHRGPRTARWGDGGAGSQDVVPLLKAEGLRFDYPARTIAALEGCDLTLLLGDRVVLRGPSGAGKSTLVSLLAGLRVPQEGGVYLRGRELAEVPARRWRHAVVVAPQFHENHVLGDTFAFNLLMGRRWPPRQEDLAEAEAVCRELGLGGLLERMPGGLQQIVGETGWQLSHGERSRLFAARALLQGAQVVILDESFAALDPETLAITLRCVTRRAPSLIVIAHD
jgi:ATP-binding cassette subfamily B protein